MRVLLCISVRYTFSRSNFIFSPHVADCEAGAKSRVRGELNDAIAYFKRSVDVGGRCDSLFWLAVCYQESNNLNISLEFLEKVTLISNFVSHLRFLSALARLPRSP